MRCVFAVVATIAAVAFPLSCGVGTAYNCFSTADCPQGSACVENACVEGTSVAKDAGVPVGDSGGASGDGGSAKDAGTRDAGSGCGELCVPGCQECIGGACANMDGVECCTDGDCAIDNGGSTGICDPIAHTCESKILCEGPCNSTGDCAFRCGDSSHVCTGGTCQTAQCQNDAPCRSLCAPDDGACAGGTCQCHHQPVCEDLCNADAECVERCEDAAMICTNHRCVPAPTCNEEACAKQCAPWASICDNGRCLCEAGVCKSDDECAKACYPDSGTCEYGKCACGGCSGACGDSFRCGQSDGCGGSCPGWCNDASQKCEPTPDGSWFCTGGCNPECGNSLCGGPDGCGGSCPGQCPDPGKTCKLLDGGGYACIGGECDPNGAPAGSPCEADKVCACGNNCVRLQADQQTLGECLPSCLNGGSCSDPSEACVCAETNAGGSCLRSSCFATGKLTGNFTAKVMNTCQDQPAQSDIGQGSLSLAYGGKSYTWNLFLACRYAEGGDDLVILYGLKLCGQNACPDYLQFFTQTSALSGAKAPATFQVNGGSLYIRHDAYTYSGQTLTDAWMRGMSGWGSVTYTAVGTTGKQTLSGSADVTMVSYDVEYCNEQTGVPVKCSAMEP